MTARPWPADTRPEPQQIARWLKGLPVDELADVIRSQQAAWDNEGRCLLENHDGRIAQMQALLETPRVVHIPDTVSREELERRITEQMYGPQQVMLLPEPRPRPVPFLFIPAEGTCGKEPPADWCAGALREVYPEAAGVSQCARTPDHPAPCIGMVWSPNIYGQFVAIDVMFPDES